MTAGEKLFVACLRSADHKTLSVIQRKWLDGDEVKMHSFIMEYYKEHGELAGIRVFCDKFKLDEKLVDAKPSYYLNEVKERFIFAKISDNVPKILRGVKDSPRDRLKDLQSLVATLAVDAVESKDTLYSDDADVRMHDYEEREKSLGVTYLSMGTPDMDKLFYGYQQTDLITIGGKAGQGKTWLMVFLAYLLERVLISKEESGHKFGDILFITNEMADKEIKERLDCIRFKLPFGKFMSGTLSAREKRRYFRGLKSLETSKIRLVDGCQTIDELSTYMGLYQPSVIFIDGSYLMEGKMPEGWEKIIYITRNLKRLSKKFKIPIVNTTQLKRGSSKSGSKMAVDGQDDFAYSSSYTQDSDIAIRMFQDADMKFHDVVGCEIVKGRRTAGGTVIFQNDLNNMCLSLTLPAEEELKTEKMDLGDGEIDT